MTFFFCSPGSGGIATRGGGGGGLLVDGEGPPSPANHHAKGYGAGGVWGNTGNAGVIVVYYN